MLDLEDDRQLVHPNHAAALAQEEVAEVWHKRSGYIAREVPIIIHCMVLTMFDTRVAVVGRRLYTQEKRGTNFPPAMKETW